MMMKSSAREDRLGFISDLESSHNHVNRAKSVLVASRDETVSQPDEIISLGDLGPNPESVKNDDKSLI